MGWSLAGSWRWLRRASNRTILGWLGGGLIVLAGGLWIVFTVLCISRHQHQLFRSHSRDNDILLLSRGC
jgi:hypothetical protein